MDSMQFWKDLTKLIEYAGNKLKDENSDTGSLRKIQLFLKSTSPQCSFNNDEYFLIFFLDSFIEKIFFNLVGDVPYEEGVTKEIQINFYNKIGEVLTDLSKNLQQDTLSTTYHLYAQLGAIYLKVIDELNDKLKCNGS